MSSWQGSVQMQSFTDGANATIQRGDDDATLFCEVIKPGIQNMIANKEKHSDLGLK